LVILTLCPVSALLAYMVRRGNRPGPLFFQDGRPLMRPCFIAEVRKALLAAGINLKRVVSVLGLPPLLLGKGWKMLR